MLHPPSALVSPPSMNRQHSKIGVAGGIRIGQVAFVQNSNGLTTTPVTQTSPDANQTCALAAITKCGIFLTSIENAQ